MSAPTSQKVLLMGLGASGKSSIRSVVFEGKQPEEMVDYSATINYTRSSKNLVGTNLQIFDLGGQESFINNFVGEQAEFIFNEVQTLVWVVDVTDFDQVSTSKFYFDLAIKQLAKYSPKAVVHCLFHKIDLLQLEMRKELFETMQQFFVTEKAISLTYHSTTIFDSSVFEVFGEVIQGLISESTQGKSITEAVQTFLQQTQEIAGITVYTDEGLPVFEEGDNTDKIVVPANLWLTSSERIVKEYATNSVLKSTIETDNFFFTFQIIKNSLLLAGIGSKISSLQLVLVKMDQLANIMAELL